jgi:hypothetical protein
MGQEGRDRAVPDGRTLLQIDLENVGAVGSKCKYGIIAKLGTLVQFELLIYRLANKRTRRHY